MPAETKLTPAVQAAICAELRNGLPRRRAAALQGIDEGTVSRWYRGGASDRAPKRLRDFREAVDRAEAECQRGWLLKASKGRSARDYLQLLIRRFADEWGRRDNVPPDDSEQKAADAASVRQVVTERFEKILATFAMGTPAPAAEAPPVEAPPAPAEQPGAS